MRTSLAHLIAARPWAVDAYSALWRELNRLAGGVEVEIDQTSFEARARAERSFRDRLGAVRSGAVDVIPVYNVITQRYSWLTWALDGTALDWLRAAIAESVADPDVAAIVLDVDSPGGSVDGLIEFAADLRVMAAQKPIVAVVNPTDASAAYWITSQSTEIVITPSGSVGSVGVYAMHVDQSRLLDAEGVTVTMVHAGPYKVEGNPYEPLTEEARATLQAEVDHFYRAFTGDVAKGRGTQVSTVIDAYGGGRMVMPAAAQAAGMVDRIDTLSNTVKRYQRGAAAGSRGRADAGDHDVTAADANAAPSAEEGTTPDPAGTTTADPLISLEERKAAMRSHRESFDNQVRRVALG